MYTWSNFKLVVTVVALVMAAACSLFQEEVSVPHAFELHINKPATPEPKFVVLQDVHATSDLLDEYGDNIKNISVKSVAYTVRNFSGSHDAVISGDISFAPHGSNDFIVLNTITDLHLRKMEESGQVNTVAVQDALASKKLAKLLQHKNKITFRLTGTTLESNPVAASLDVVVHSKLTVAQ
ncbi:hypothetical protein ACXYMU_01365 [Pontibacter sp. CAU 1760]